MGQEIFEINCIKNHTQTDRHTHRHIHADENNTCPKRKFFGQVIICLSLVVFTHWWVKNVPVKLIALYNWHSKTYISAVSSAEEARAAVVGPKCPAAKPLVSNNISKMCAKS